MGLWGCRMNEYIYRPLGENVEEMFIGPFGSSLKNECFVDKEEAYCMVYEQKHAIQKTMDVETRYINEQKYNELKRFNVRSGDIIVSCRGTIGETYIIPDGAPLGIMHPSIMKIRLKEGVYDKYYFNLLLRSRLKKHESEANGSGVKMAVSATELSKELLPVPTMNEQLKITDIVSKINNVIGKRKQELAELDDLIKTRFVELFGNPAVNEKNWEIKDLESVTTIVTYGLTVRPEYIDKGIDLVSAREIHKGYVAYDEAPKISEEDFAKLSEKGKPQKFDILFSKTGSIGHCALVEDDRNFAITQNAARIGLKLDLINPIWLLYYLRMDFIQDWCKGHAKGNAVKDFQLQDMKIIPLFDCPMELQKQFATFVHQVHKSKVAIQKALDEMQILFDSLLQKYFS